ncbi:hypothetical protein GCM10009678_74750 [Actinomadura kijaniata]
MACGMAVKVSSTAHRRNRVCGLAQDPPPFGHPPPGHPVLGFLTIPLEHPPVITAGPSHPLPGQRLQQLPFGIRQLTGPILS